MHPKALDVTAELLERVMRLTNRADVESREDVLHYVCEALFHSGAEHVRFYEIGEETIPDLPTDPTMYLTWQEAAPGQPLGRQAPGYAIPFDKATLSRQEPKLLVGERPLLQPVIESSVDHPARWVDDHDLRGRVWIDVAVYDHNRFIGVLAFDWTPDPAELQSVRLEPTEKTILLLLGQLVGAQVESATPRVETDLRKQVRHLYREETTQYITMDSLLQKAVAYFQETVDISSVSIFRYDWARQLLVREAISTLRTTAERPTANASFDEAPRFAREVFSVDDKLTGLAWNNRQYRRVLNFESLRKQRPDLISTESMDYHSKNIGTVETVMYGIVGDRDSRYLLRMINNHGQPGLPFLSQFDLLNRFLADIAPTIDNQAADVRAGVVRSIQDAVNMRETPEKLFDLAATALQQTERIAPVAVIAQRERRRPHIVYGVDPNRVTQVRTDVVRSNAYRKSLDVKPGIHITNAAALKVTRGLLKDFPDTSHVATLTLNAGDTRGLIIFPVTPRARSQSLEKLLISDGVNAFLAQIASLLAQGFEQQYMMAQERGALQALALVGHEMSTPLSAMSQLGQRAIEVARLYECGDGVRVKEHLDDLGERLRLQAETLEAAIRLGHVVGRQSEGKLVGVFQSNHIATLVNEAIYRTRVEISRGLLLQPTGGVRILRPTGTPNIRIACDGPLIRAALINLYRNAVKYSVERSRISTVETNVFIQQRDDRIGISITNWGIAVPDYHEELIFDAFTRYATPVDEVTRRGMGLGLYLTRQIARAHEGTAYLSHQDTDRTPSGHGLPRAHRTTFTMTVKRDLPPGPYDRKL